jgi:hypothetical protein
LICLQRFLTLPRVIANPFAVQNRFEPDGVHPTKEGNRIIAWLFAEELGAQK